MRLQAVVAGLRETAKMANEQTVTEEPSYHDPSYHSAFNRGGAQKVYTPVYSKEWIVGRLLGMADMIEAEANIAHENEKKDKPS